jgi:hypothetical protein
LGIGLPLLSLLTVSQFPGILAHESAHFYGGDTKLAPFVYKARMSMPDTFRNIKPPFINNLFLQLMYLAVYSNGICSFTSGSLALFLANRNSARMNWLAWSPVPLLFLRDCG